MTIGIQLSYSKRIGCCALNSSTSCSGSPTSEMKWNWSAKRLENSVAEHALFLPRCRESAFSLQNSGGNPPDAQFAAQSIFAESMRSSGQQQ